MDCTRILKTMIIIVLLVTFIGCKSKEEKSALNSVVPQKNSALPTDKQAATVVAPQDNADAQAGATRILALMEKGDFSGIYKDSAAGFKQIGSESQFVEKFQQTRKNVGVLKNPQQISFGTLPGNGFVYVYRLENERYKTDLRLTFTRSQSGKMELAGLNQHDEMKK